WYFNGSWRFFDEPNNNFIQYYWPHSGTLDFFAYMPYKDSPRNKNISIRSYSPKSSTLSSKLGLACSMQEEIDLEDSEGQETIIAFTPNKSKNDGVVNMYFVHPFAAVYFKLKQAHRDLTINWIRFDNVYLKGTTTLTTQTDTDTNINWTPEEGEGLKSFKVNVIKIIPDDINFGGEIGGPYLVMPQSFRNGDVTITISYTWDDGIDDNGVNDGVNPEVFTRSITTSSVTGWTAGNKYTYILDLGDNKEEILFKVEVEPWIQTGEKNIIDVE
ncbi:MAG: fimbrillin family protein, partial [Parabacteroides sp.]|nr:fimbrillin family protein [Parabacteroides sp.]